MLRKAIDDDGGCGGGEGKDGSQEVCCCTCGPAAGCSGTVGLALLGPCSAMLPAIRTSLIRPRRRLCPPMLP